VETVWDGSFLFQHDTAPEHKARYIQKWFVKIGVEDLDWPAQSPDINPIKHLWDDLERRLRASPNHPTSVPNLTDALVDESKQIPAEMFQHLVEILPRRVEAVIAAKGDQLHINAHDFGTRCSTSRCPHTFGNVVYITQKCGWVSCYYVQRNVTPALQKSLSTQNNNLIPSFSLIVRHSKLKLIPVIRESKLVLISSKRTTHERIQLFFSCFIRTDVLLPYLFTCCCCCYCFGRVR
jgi:hypothetical protein